MDKNRKLRTAILPIILVVALLAAGIFYYLNNIQNSLWNQAVSEVLEVTSQGSHAFEVYIEKDMQILTRMAKQLLELDSGDDAGIMDAIDAFEDSEVHFTVIDLSHGLMYDRGAGRAREMDKEELALYGAFAERDIREPYLDEYTGRTMIGGYQRFTFSDGADGMIQVKRRRSAVAEEFMLSFYKDTGFSYIVNKQGDIILRPAHKNSNSTFANILDVMELSGNSKESVQAFKDSMAQKKEGVMRLNMDGEEDILAFTPINGTDGWLLVTILPDNAVMRHAGEILQSSQTFLLLLGGILIAAAMFLYMRQKSYKKIAQQEDDLQYREQLFGILANNTNDVFFMFTPEDYQVEYVSPNIERVLGIPREQAMKDIRVLNTDSGDLGTDFVERLERGDSAVYEKERMHKKSGESRWFTDTVYRTALNGTERFVSVLSDRTQERRNELALKDALEMAKAANEAKSTFLSNMSHDIRTPMNAIVGLSTLLQRDAYQPEKVLEHTRKITSSSQHLLGLINDVLDMSKIESGKATLNISEISLAEIVDELGTMMQPQAKAKGQEFTINVYDICNEEILGDRLRINQILINILSNAVKYTPEGGKIEMTLRQLPQYSKNYARFVFIIKDNGIGMSEEYLKNIFQPFTREDTKKTLGIQGTGLGMAITKNLAELMGGTVEVESELDKGSTFKLNLELRIKEQSVDPDFWKNHGVTHMLVVDDDEEICVGIKNAMADTGVGTQYALGGQAAVAMAQDAQAVGNGFDLVIIDWQMPDISGIETARRIRQIVPANVPVMILTAYDIGKIEEEGVAAGIDGFLQKPFFLSNLKLMLSSLNAGSGAGQKQEVAKWDDDILNGMHILAAEDIELNIEILVELLKMVGATCEWASNGREAFEKFEQSDADGYDLILMDVQMPEMNGYDAARAIRGCAHPRAKTVPIIAMTANAFSEDVKDALDAGMDAHVAKPIDMEHLKAVIKDVMAVR